MSRRKKLMKSRQLRRQAEDEAAAKVDADGILSDAEKINALAEIRRWFRADTTLVDAYLAGTLTASEVAEQMARPIEETYSSADHGRRLYGEEMSARRQRTYHTPEKALEMWGPEEDIPEPEEWTADLPTTEGQLWELWYGFLHAARRIPYTDTAQQEKLLGLLRTLKARPNPKPPTPMTIPLRRHWIWETGTLWSDLVMFGFSVTETFNDTCGCGAGYLPNEMQAWLNFTSFIARGTGSGVSDSRWIGIVALVRATEDDLTPLPKNQRFPAPVLTKLQYHVPEAALWILLAGEKALESYPRLTTGQDVKVVEEFIGLKGKDLPWKRSKRKYKGPRYEDMRMEFLRKRLEIESQNEGLSLDARLLARQAADKVASLMQPEKPSGVFSYSTKL